MKRWLVLFAVLTAGTVSALRAQFVDRAMEVGVEHEHLNFTYFGGGSAIFDMNNDGLLDLYFIGATNGDKLYLNNGETFDRVLNYFGPEDFDLYNLPTTAVAAGDVNNDGFTDLFVTTYTFYPNLLLMNTGNNRFDAVRPDSSGLEGEKWGMGGTFGDVNKDGLLDLFVVNYIDTIRTMRDSLGFIIYQHDGFKNDLYINQGNAVFQEMSDAYGITNRGTSLAACFTDYDTDGHSDLYVINDFGQFIVPNELYRNQYPQPAMEDVSRSTNANIGLFGMGVAVGDYDNDLDLDYYVTNLGSNALLRNNGAGMFEDVAEAEGLLDTDLPGGFTAGWGTGFFDADNNGLLDLYLVNGYIPSADEYWVPVQNPNRLFYQTVSGFEDVSRDMGFEDAATDRGSAYGDIDNDGDLDLVVVPVSRGAPEPDSTLRTTAAIYYNEQNEGNDWIQFFLVGTESNRNGYGSLVWLYRDGQPRQLRECDGGSSHASSNSPIIHFGLGPSATVDSVLVQWPSGIRQAVRYPEINTRHTVVEAGSGQPVAVFEDAVMPIRVWPNPVHSVMRVHLPDDLVHSGPGEWTLVNSLGQKVVSGFPMSSIFEIDMIGVSPGLYQLLLSVDGLRRGSARIVKN